MLLFYLVKILGKENLWKQMLAKCIINQYHLLTNTETNRVLTFKQKIREANEWGTHLFKCMLITICYKYWMIRH